MKKEEEVDKWVGSCKRKDKIGGKMYVKEKGQAKRGKINKSKIITLVCFPDHCFHQL